jgi:thioesterase domain-containing protein
MSDTDMVLGEVRAERERQDEEWGGPEHDDRHSPLDWHNYLQKQMGRAAEAFEATDRKRWRTAMLKTAALAVAAVESSDRSRRAQTDQDDQAFRAETEQIRQTYLETRAEYVQAPSEETGQRLKEAERVLLDRLVLLSNRLTKPSPKPPYTARQIPIRRDRDDLPPQPDRRHG